MNRLALAALAPLTLSAALLLGAPRLVAQDEEPAATAPSAEDDARAEAAEIVELVGPLMDRGDYETAQRKLRRAVKADPTNERAALLLAASRRELGKLDKALEVLAPFDASADALARRGDLLLLAGRTEEAEASCQAALAVDEGHLPARRLLGAAMEDLGRRDEALDQYKDINSRWAKSTGKDSDDTLIAVARARAGIFRLSDEFRPRAASILARLEPVVNRSPERVDAFVELGDLYLAMHQDQDALKWFKKAVEKNSHYAPALFGMARQKAFRFDGPAARKDAERAIAENPAYVPAYVYLAEMDLGDGRYERARKHLDTALAVNPNARGARAAQAAFHYLKLDQAAFENEVAAILERDRFASVAYRSLARILEEQRRFAEALAMAERAIEVDERDFDAYFLAGRNAMNMGEDAKAEEYLLAAEKGDLFRNVFRANFVKLFNKMQRFPAHEDPTVVIKLPAVENDAYYPLLRDGVTWSLGELEARWNYTPEKPLFLSVFDVADDFAARTIGLPGFPALGACFGRVVTLDSPRALPPGAFGWRGTLHHELAHVVTLGLSKGRVPRWLTEGISVYEERKISSQWNREMERDLIDAIASDEVLTLANINGAFRGPRVLYAYYQGGLMCELIERDFGFDSLREMVRLYGEGLHTPAVVKKALNVEPKEFDARFLAFAKEYVAPLSVMPRPSRSKLGKLRRHLRKNKKDLDGWLLFAQGQLAQGKSTDALSALARAVEIAPEDARIPAIRALVAQRQQRPDTAKRFAEEAIAGGVELFELRILLADASAKAGNFGEAKTHLRRSIELFPTVSGPSSPRLLLAKLLLGEGEDALGPAMQLLREHADVAEDDFTTRQRLADWYRNQGEAAAELATLLEIRDVVPLPHGNVSRSTTVELHGRIGELLLEQKDYAPAELARRLAVATARMDLGADGPLPIDGPELSELLFLHAETLHLLGQMDEARRSLDDALSADPENGDAQELRDRIRPE